MVRTFTSDSYIGGDTQGIEKLGKAILSIHKERMEEKNFYSKEDLKNTEEFLNTFGELVNDSNTSKEDLTFDNNGALYTTVVADFVERKLRPKLVAEGVIKRVRVDAKGTSAIKIPISELVTASDLPDSGNVSYASNDYTSQSITIGWVYAAQKITYELIEQSNVDIIQDQLMELGDAIARKIDSDIIAAIDSAITSSNGTDLGSGSYITYTDFLSAYANAIDNYAEPDVILTNSATWVKLMSDTDVKSALHFNSVQPGSIFPLTQTFFGMKLIVSPQVSSGTLYLIDSKRTGYFVESSEVKVFNGRVSGALAEEVIAAKLYGVGIVQPNSVYRVRENI